MSSHSGRRARWRAALLALATVVGVLAIIPAAPASAGIGHDNTVFAFGNAPFLGSTQNLNLAQPVVGMASTAGGSGYWLVAKDGGVFSFHANFYGGTAGFPLAAPITGMAATADSHGYWLVGADGHVYPFGDAHQYGGMEGHGLNAPIISIIPGPGGLGYWLYAADGGVFSFGSAKFHGSTGGMRLNAPVVGMTATATGKGYWLVAKDGGVFTFGDAKFHGSTGSLRLNAPVVGMGRDGTGNGYWLGAEDGGVFTFGDAHFEGSAVGLLPHDRHIMQFLGMPVGNGYRMLAAPNVADVALMNVGAQGAAVSYLQTRLLAQGYWIPGVNGSFDRLTQQAVWAFQKANGLPRSGNVDGATQAAFRTAPRPHPRSGSGYLFEVDKTRQILMIVNNGIAQWTFNISSGSDIPYHEGANSGNAHTPEGVFSIVSQIDGADNAPLGLLWRPKFFTFQGHAIHGAGNVPPYPASHGCVRVTDEAMNWIWATNVLPLGTTVWVYS
jgi:hypothetical protein